MTNRANPSGLAPSLTPAISDHGAESTDNTVLTSVLTIDPLCRLPLPDGFTEPMESSDPPHIASIDVIDVIDVLKTSDTVPPRQKRSSGGNSCYRGPVTKTSACSLFSACCRKNRLTFSISRTHHHLTLPRGRHGKPWCMEQTTLDLTVRGLERGSQADSSADSPPQFAIAIS